MPECQRAQTISYASPRDIVYDGVLSPTYLTTVKVPILKARGCMNLPLLAPSYCFNLSHTYSLGLASSCGRRTVSSPTSISSKLVKNLSLSYMRLFQARDICSVLGNNDAPRSLRWSTFPYIDASTSRYLLTVLIDFDGPSDRRYRSCSVSTS